MMNVRLIMSVCNERLVVRLKVSDCGARLKENDCDVRLMMPASVKATDDGALMMSAGGWMMMCFGQPAANDQPAMCAADGG